MRSVSLLGIVGRTGESPFCCDSSGCVVGAGVLSFGHHRAALAGGFCCPDTWCRCAL